MPHAQHIEQLTWLKPNNIHLNTILFSFLFIAVDHLYTTDQAERDNAIQYLGYTDEGIAGYVCTSAIIVALPTQAAQCQSTVPIYRSYNAACNDHFYTADLAESENSNNRLGYTFEGIAWFMYSTQVEGTIPLYRMYNPAVCDHFYTTSSDEMTNAVKNLGYQEEGVLGYLYPDQVQGTSPVYRLYSIKWV